MTDFLHADQPEYCANLDSLNLNALDIARSFDAREIADWWIEGDDDDRAVIDSLLNLQRKAQYAAQVEAQRWW